MSKVDRRAAIRYYRQTPRPAGVFRVRNTTTGQALIGSALDLPGMLNRQRFQLENGAHPSGELQAEWNELGPGAFEFEVLDRLEMPDDPGYDPKEDLAALKAMWIEEETASGRTLYREVGRDTRDDWG